METSSGKSRNKLLTMLMVFVLPGCGGVPGSADNAASQTQMSTAASVGELLFDDVALSASGRQSCASCHDPAIAYTAPNSDPVPFGGSDMTLQGVRNTPTVLYASSIPGFVKDRLGPRGGIMHDGRLENLAEQAQKPFTSKFEMGNTSSAQLRDRLLTRPYLSLFKTVFGQEVLNDPDATLAAIGKAIAAYEIESAEFHPFSSKYDAYIQGKALLSTQELAGLAAFNAADRGHCAACHASSGTADKPALFTNHTYHVLGVPRNWKITYNLDSTVLPDFVPANGKDLGEDAHQYYDLGLCGPYRTDLANETSLCGAFKVPTLRNVGIKRTYFHNGVFTNLNDVVSFYATRNSNPARWYVKADGTPDVLYNDLPPVYAANVEPVNHPGGPLSPNLSNTDVQNIVRFLCTLNDGFDPENPASYNTSGQCAGI